MRLHSYKAQQTVKFNGLKFFLSIIIGVMVLILYVSEQVYIFSLEKKVNELRKEQIAFRTRLTKLKIEAVSLRKGSRIKNIAYESLGLNFPEGAPERLF